MPNPSPSPKRATPPSPLRPLSPPGTFIDIRTRTAPPGGAGLKARPPPGPVPSPRRRIHKPIWIQSRVAESTEAVSQALIALNGGQKVALIQRTETPTPRGGEVVPLSPSVS